VHVFNGVGLDVGHQSDPEQLGERMRYDSGDHDRSDAPQCRVFLQPSDTVEKFDRVYVIVQNVREKK